MPGEMGALKAANLGSSHEYRYMHTASRVSHREYVLGSTTSAVFAFDPLCSCRYIFPTARKPRSFTYPAVVHDDGEQIELLREEVAQVRVDEVI
jgi:hypothetical protein